MHVMHQVKNVAAGTAQHANKQSAYTRDEINKQAAATWQAVTKAFEGTWAEMGEYVEAAADQVLCCSHLTPSERDSHSAQSRWDHHSNHEMRSYWSTSPLAKCRHFCLAVISFAHSHMHAASLGSETRNNRQAHEGP